MLYDTTKQVVAGEAFRAAALCVTKRLVLAHAVGLYVSEEASLLDEAEIYNAIAKLANDKSEALLARTSATR